MVYSSDRCQSHILVENCHFAQFGGLSRNTGITFGMEKLEWCGYPTVKKKFEDMFIRFDRIHERDRQTDRQMDTALHGHHDGIGRAYA